MPKAIKIIKHLEKSILDIILPKHCLSCNKEGDFLCDNCLEKIELNSFQICPICQKSLTEYGEVCRYCKEFKPEIDSLTVATNYKDKSISKAIHLFKYKFVEELSSPLSKIIIKSYQKNKLPIPDLIIPVPLHPLRLRWRGFNQAELLAKDIGDNLLPDLPIKTNPKIIIRNKFTATQAKLKKLENRQKNISGAFYIDPKFSDLIKNKRILLVDDVCTTGSTLFESAKQLRQLRPKAIHAIVVARQS